MSVISNVLYKLGQEQEIREKKWKALKTDTRRDCSQIYYILEDPEQK